MGELNETSSFLKIVEEEIESGEVKQKSRLQILNDLSIKWGAKDNVESFEDFIHTYNTDAISASSYGRNVFTRYSVS